MIDLNITKKYFEGSKDEFTVLDDCVLKIDDGENVLINGENGSGKTSLLKIIGLIDKKYKGSYFLSGVDVDNVSQNKISKLRNKEIGFVFQDYNLIENEKVSYNISIPLFYTDKFGLLEKKSRIKEVSQFLEMDGLLNKKVKHLSGGEKQKVAIARAIINKPNVLILDEPMSSLAPRFKNKFLEFILNYSKNDNTIIMVSHDTNDIEGFTVYNMEYGKLCGI